MKNRLTPLTIPREMWGVGRKGGYLLKGSSGLMCALGFCCVARGIPKEVIKDKCMPSDLFDDHDNMDESILAKREHWLEGIIIKEKDAECGYVEYGDESACSDISQFNDSEEISQPEREDKIASAMKELGFKVTFTGQLPPA